MTTLSSSQAASLKRVMHGTEPFSLVRERSRSSPLGKRVHVFEGRISLHNLLSEISTGDEGPPERIETVSAIPFSQIRERGYEAHRGDERISTMRVESRERISRSVALELLPAEPIVITTPTFDRNTDEYADVVREVQRNEIGRGEGSNFVVANTARFQIEEMSRAKALSVFRKLLETEFGAYMHFLYYDGLRYIVGASPERHLTVEGGEVTMNPISGTFRKEGQTLLRDFKDRLIAFLRDPKEIMELHRVLDEELKMMAEMCPEGGVIIGPILREMLKLIHTEYELVGRSREKVIDLFRMSMFAPTVIGGPVGNACRVIRKYEEESRGYYGSAMMIHGRDSRDFEFLDSGITIRTAEIGLDGTVTARAGATIVRDSNPSSEAQEVVTKAAGLLGAFRNTHERCAVSVPALPSGGETEREVLDERTNMLSPYYHDNQRAADLRVEKLEGKKITILRNGDDFGLMLRNMIVHMGAHVTVIAGTEFDPGNDDSDIVIIGPGPGDPTVMTHLHETVRVLKERGIPMAGVCLGHQVIAHTMGMNVRLKEEPTQGVRREISLNGTPAHVMFYNSFAAEAKEVADFRMDADGETGEVHAMSGPGVETMQFHPESAMTENGFELLKNALLRLV